jgi:hypothetical protein
MVKGYNTAAELWIIGNIDLSPEVEESVNV